MALITVVVPVYQEEAFLHRCVSSILEQSFQNFEVILVDDGAIDGSGRICDEFAMKDDRIRVIHKRNGGLSSARNSGIDWTFENSDSEWLTFIDSDDWLHPAYLEYLYRAASENHVQISVCNYMETEMTVPFLDQLFESESWDWASFLMKNNVQAIIACNKLYLKHLFSGLRYPIGKVHEDEFVTYKLLHMAGEVSYVPLPLYYYFRNPDSITHKNFSLQRLDAADALQERIHYVQKLNNDELTIFCLCQFFSYCLKMIPILHNADWIPQDVRVKKEKEIHRRFQSVLAHYGMRYTPPNIYGAYYDYAFPVLYHTARRCARLIKSIMKAKEVK